MIRNVYWTPEMDALIRDVRGATEVRALAAQLCVRVRALMRRRRELRGSQARREWTLKELKDLKVLVDAGVRPRKIAANLGRSVSSVYVAINKVKDQVSPENASQVPVRSGFWSGWEERRLVQLLAQDLKITRIAAELGRSYESVSQKALKVRKQARSLGADLEQQLARMAS